jgi:hypothetical protein
MLPNAVNAARKHFNCDTIDGVGLEEYGGQGTAGSHWEKVLFGTELMVGSSDQRGVSR